MESELYYRLILNEDEANELIRVCDKVLSFTNVGFARHFSHEQCDMMRAIRDELTGEPEAVRDVAIRSEEEQR